MTNLKRKIATAAILSTLALSVFAPLAFARLTTAPAWVSLSRWFSNIYILSWASVPGAAYYHADISFWDGSRWVIDRTFNQYSRSVSVQLWRCNTWWVGYAQGVDRDGYGPGRYSNMVAPQCGYGPSVPSSPPPLPSSR